MHVPSCCTALSQMVAQAFISFKLLSKNSDLVKNYAKDKKVQATFYLSLLDETKHLFKTILDACYVLAHFVLVQGWPQETECSTCCDGWWLLHLWF